MLTNHITHIFLQLCTRLCYLSFHSTELYSEYNLQRAELRFPACATKQCLNVSIIDDLLVEDTETFTIHLETSLGLSNEFEVNPSVKVINITDNDGVCTLTLQTSSVI